MSNLVKIPLRDIRKFMGFRQNEFAKKIGMNRLDYIKFESGNFNNYVRGFHLMNILNLIKSFNKNYQPRIPWSWYLDTCYLFEVSFEILNIDSFYPVEKANK